MRKHYPIQSSTSNKLTGEFGWRKLEVMLMKSDHLSCIIYSRPPVTAIVSVWIPIIAISVRIVVVVIVMGRVPGTTWIVVIGIPVWIIGFPLIAIIVKRIIPPALHADRIIIGHVSTARNPTRSTPDLFLIMIRLCQAN
jgi:hypothetical protein